MMKEVNLFLFITNLSIAVLAGALLPLLPVLTRKSFLFGVRIPLEEHGCAEAKKLRKNYITVCLAGTAVIFALIIAQYIVFPDMTLAAMLYFPLLFVPVQMAAYVPNWKRAGKLKEEKGWKISASSFAETQSSHSRGNLSDLPWIWYILGILLIFVSVIVTLAQYPNLPDPMPTHFDFNMQPDAWSEKNLTTVLAMPIINFATLALMWFVNFMYIKTKLQLDPQNPELSFTQHRIYRRRIGHSLGILALGLVIVFALIGFMSIFPDIGIPVWLIIFLCFVPVIPLLAVTIASGQGGFKIKPKTISVKSAGNYKAPSGVEGVPGRGDDKYWAIGMFYHNPDDPAVMIEDRFGINLGFNYARLPVKIGVAILGLALIAMYAGFTVYMFYI